MLQRGPALIGKKKKKNPGIPLEGIGEQFMLKVIQSEANTVETGLFWGIVGYSECFRRDTT
ncbi:MAG: hypothetical protein JAY75_22410, partial [Candidatus Thiodiazotropha taylori]|nr:hypothetical protein [Candidatus Thiodiazotropha taylori]MCW4310973.1 hypothetical protein [Candidatus Thiodiazotropha endolucinida]